MSEALMNLSDGLADAVTCAEASIVRVEGRHRLPATGIVWSADGVIVTAHHVLERDEEIGVGLPDGGTAIATLVGRDPSTDIAVLRADVGSLTPAIWATADELRVGHLVLALGRPGHRVRAALGIAGAVGGAWRTPAGGRIDRYWQTDLVLYPGFSGGPLVNAAGRCLGMNSSALLRDASAAVPITTLTSVIQTLLTYGHTPRGYLGIGLQPVRLPQIVARELEQDTGLLLLSVEPDGPAGQAGLALGDTLVSIDDQPTRHPDELAALLSGDRIGATVEIRFVRGGQIQTLTAVIGQSPE